MSNKDQSVHDMEEESDIPSESDSQKHVKRHLSGDTISPTATASSQTVNPQRKRKKLSQGKRLSNETSQPQSTDNEEKLKIEFPPIPLSGAENCWNCCSLVFIV